MHIIKCKQCGKEIDALEVFPKGICIDCHEKQFNINAEWKKTQKEGFTNQLIKSIK